MNLGFMHRTILKADGTKAFQLPPIAGAEALFEMDKIADSLSGGNRFDVTDRPDDLE